MHANNNSHISISALTSLFELQAHIFKGLPDAPLWCPIVIMIKQKQIMGPSLTPQHVLLAELPITVNGNLVSPVA